MPIQATKNIIDAYISLIEGSRLKAYPDSGGVLTIGHGHTGPDVHLGEVITERNERALLEGDMLPLYRVLDPVIHDPLKYLAYASFGYNCGVGALQSVLRGKSFIEHYIHDHKGNVLPGLVSRRRFELALLGRDISVFDNPIPETRAV